MANLQHNARYAAGAYRAAGVPGEPGPVVLVVCRDPVWLARYRHATARLALPVEVAFATLSDVEQHGPAAAIGDLADHLQQKQGVPADHLNLYLQRVHPGTGNPR